MREPETQETFDVMFPTGGMDAMQIAKRIQDEFASMRGKEIREFVGGLFLRHGYFNGRIDQEATHEGDTITCKAVVSCYGLPNRSEPGDVDTRELLESLEANHQAIGRDVSIYSEAAACIRQLEANVGGGDTAICQLEQRLTAAEADNKRLRDSLAELVQAMRQYEMDVDTDPPHKHRDMMARAEAAIRRG